jgi:steroid delta-isomerase-like uncharacterized protein
MATTLPDTNIERIRWAFSDVLNTKDVTELRQFWSDRTEQRFPDRTCRGADEIAAYFQGVFDAMPDFHMKALTITGDDDNVFVHWRMTGHHTGIPFQGIAATGSAIDLEGMDHFEFDADGMVKRNTILYDQMAFARQIGFVPADGSGADKAAKAAFNAKTRLVEKVRARRG